MEFEGWKQWAYIVACVVAPASWGMVSAWLFARRDSKSSAKSANVSSVDYMI